MGLIKVDLKTRLSKLSRLSDERLSLGQVNKKKENQEKLRAGAHPKFGRPPTCTQVVAANIPNDCGMQAGTSMVALRTYSTVVPVQRKMSHDVFSPGWTY
jgi:hypothetical protein